jgi:hypothetical protein
MALLLQPSAKPVVCCILPSVRSGLMHSACCATHACMQAYMPVQSAPNPPGPGSSQQQQQPSSQQQQSVTIGSRSERWALYHQLTLVERAFRRVAPLTSIPGQSFGQGSGAGQIGRVTDSGAPQGPSTPVKQAGTANGAHSAADATAASPGGLAAAIAAGAAAAADTYDYAMNAHLTWILPPVANLLGIVHGLGAADAAGLLGPLTVSAGCKLIIYLCLPIMCGISPLVLDRSAGQHSSKREFLHHCPGRCSTYKQQLPAQQAHLFLRAVFVEHLENAAMHSGSMNRQGARVLGETLRHVLSMCTPCVPHVYAHMFSMCSACVYRMCTAFALPMYGLCTTAGFDRDGRSREGGQDGC